MQLIDGQPVFSATDLVGYLECEHLTALERAAMAGLVARPHINDPELDVLRRHGVRHEQRYMAELTAQGRSVVEIKLNTADEDRGEQLRQAAAETTTAMADGADVIYQATFFDGTWRGHADFLLRVNDADRPSIWGPYHYEVADTKLARHVKAGAVLQICTYVTMLTAIQGVEPESLQVVLGGSNGGLRTLRVADYMAYYRAARARFDAAVGPTAPAPVYPPTGSYPEPVEHCGVCRWRVTCGDRRRDDDHLSLVASISRRQRRALEDRSVHTLTELAVLPLPVEPPLAGTSRPAIERVREQARIQLEGRNRNETIYELFGAAGEAPEPGIGLAGLPPPSPGDLFFDIEGDPYAAEDGLDYLFGVSDVDGRFTAIWSRDAAGDFTLDGEKAAFERLMDLFMERLVAFPDAHIFHFAPYEPTSLKRMMGRHATREDEVDRLLRGDVLVDLYRIVKQSLRASVESYSIKKLEALYDFERVVNLRDAGSSIVVFEEWLQLGDTERPGANHLDRIEAYNRDDVDSNQRLRDWLEARREQLAEQIGEPVPRPGPGQPDPSPALSENQAKVQALLDRLTAGVPEEGRTPDQQARWLLAQLLGWHRRENKSMWWQYFYLKDDLTDADRIEAKEPISGLTYVGMVEEIKQSLVHRYAFPEQEYEIKAGTVVHDPSTGKPPGEVREIDEAGRTVDLIRGRASIVPHPTALIPYEYVPANAQEAALMRLGNWVADHQLDDPGPHRAALDMLRRHAPRVGQHGGAPLRAPNEDDLTAALRLALDLDQTVLPIQGPPGSGKTYAGARMALALIDKGFTVGITANSHRVISNFLRELCDTAEKARHPISVIQKANEEDGCPHPFVHPTPENQDVDREVATGLHQVVAGTSWLFARPELAEKLDVLFVDEAGQLSLANTLASAQAARNVVLLGDPQQLDQPLKGSHPPGAERSALGHYLGEEATIGPADGLFLETTWRLHPDLCAYTSENFYDDRLAPKPHLGDQIVHGPAPLGGTGPRLVEVRHDHNDNESVEEARAIATMAEELVKGGATWINQDGLEQPIDWSQIVIVAAYNAQVGAIKTLLPQARVGTVDKFQGQEAPISIYSMASSSVEDAPRGMTFLYSRHRLNVATSRARCVAVVVASPELLRVRARSPEEMRLANALARFAEMARPVQAPPDLLGGSLR